MKLSVPIIDISAIIEGEKVQGPEYQATIDKIGRACEEWGFFIVSNHGVKAEFMKKAARLAVEFFEKPKDFKRTVERSEFNLQGFSDSELTKNKVDWKQLFDMCDPELEQEGKARINVQGVNLWPKGIPEFKETMVEYFKKMQFLAKRLMEATLKSLTEETGLVEKCFANGEDTSLFRLNYYPICPHPETNFGVGPHSDPGIITVLYQDESITSLQVEKDGQFYDIAPVPDSYVINIGDMMQVYSNGKYKAPVHRVLANHTQNRLSIPFFLSPSYSCVVKPLETCVGPGRPLKYKPISWADFRRARYQGDYADVGEEIQISHFEI